MGSTWVPSDGERPHWDRDTLAREMAELEAEIAKMPPRPAYRYVIPERKSKGIGRHKFYWERDTPESEPYKVYWDHWTGSNHWQGRYSLRSTPARELFFKRHAYDFDPRYEAGPTGPKLKKRRERTKPYKSEEMIIPPWRFRGLDDLLIEGGSPPLQSEDDGQEETGHTALPSQVKGTSEPRHMANTGVLCSTSSRVPAKVGGSKRRANGQRPTRTTSAG